MREYLRFPFDGSHSDIASVIDECSLWAARFGFILLDHLELRPNLNILDLACGTGFPLFELAQIYGRTCQVIGVDSWKEAIERARSKLQTYQFPNVQLLEADAEHLPFQEQTFDMIVSNLGINNFADPPAVLAECFRVAKPGAQIVLTTNPIGHMSEFYEVFRQIVSEFQKPAYMERLQIHEAHRGTKGSLRSLLQAGGFHLVDVKEEQFQLRYLNGSAFFNHALTKLGFLEGWRRVVDPEDEEQVFTFLENKLNQIADTYGELRMTVPILSLKGKKIA